MKLPILVLIAVNFTIPAFSETCEYYIQPKQALFKSEYAAKNDPWVNITKLTYDQNTRALMPENRFEPTLRLDLQGALGSINSLQTPPIRLTSDLAGVAAGFRLHVLGSWGREMISEKVYFVERWEYSPQSCAETDDDHFSKNAEVACRNLYIYSDHLWLAFSVTRGCVR